MSPRAGLAIAATVALVEYLLISLAFDARELVPASLEGIGQLAPIPLLAVVASLVLRTGSSVTPHSSAGAVSPRRAAALLGAQLALFALLVGVSLALARGASAWLQLAWAVLVGLAAAPLLIVALGGVGLAGLGRLAAPLGLGALVGLAAWAAGRGTGALWLPLARATLAPIAAFVRAVSSDAVVDLDARIVGTERFAVEIAPVCSGYEGMGLVAVLMGAHVWASRASLRFPRALLLPLLGALLAFAANVVRITALVYMGSLGAPDVALGGFHSKAGWLLFSMVALGMVRLARSEVFSRGSEAASAHEENPTATFLAPLLTLTAVGLVVGLASDGGLDPLAPIAPACALATLFVLRAELRAPLLEERARVQHAGLRAVGTGIAILVMWLLLAEHAPALDAELERERTASGAAAQASWLAGRALASIVVVPIVEELGFRGFLMRRLVSADFPSVRYAETSPLALLVSSVAFGALHHDVLAATLAGAAFALIAAHTGRLRDAVVAHAVANAGLAAIVVLTGRWSYWP